MNVVNPVYFSLIFIIAGVILLYFFRKQYKEMVNPSNLLWQQTMNEWQASPWLKKLQQNLLFWLQILALCLLVAALVRPFWETKVLNGEQIVFVLDSSASMSANDQGAVRFETAKAKMLDMLEQHQGQEVTVLEAGSHPKFIVNREKETKTIIRAIQGMKLTYEHENMESAIRLAASVVKGDSAAIHIFSDQLTKEDLPKLSSLPAIEVHNAGGEIDNISLSSFGIDQEQGEIQGLASIENQTDKQKDVSFLVKNENEILFEEKVSLPPRSTTMIDIPILPDREYYSALISTKDAYMADNRMTAIASAADREVYALGDVNPFFMKGLKTLGIESTQLNKNTSNSLGNAIFISEGIQLQKLPETPVLFINKGNGEKAVKLKQAFVVSEDSLMNFVDFKKTYVESAFPPLSGDWETIVKSGDIPLIQKGSIGGQPIILLNFALESTDWPLHPGFPIFLHNSYQWLNKQSGFIGYFQPGEEKWMTASEGEDQWEIFDEKGENVDTFQMKNESFKAPYKPGLYQIASGSSVSYFAVMLDEREKKISSESSFTINNQFNKDHKAGNLIQNDTFWFGFALMAFILMLLEWEVYRRGVRG